MMRWAGSKVSTPHPLPLPDVRNPATPLDETQRLGRRVPVIFGWRDWSEIPPEGTSD